MAGIFVNVNDDIQNLRALKNEIENVKRALKGINVKVDFDIKEGLEKQLKSLTVEYDALASKIAETEGKIKVSIDRINESTQKILQAQEKIIGAAQGQSVTQQNVAATNAETSSVQAQSKAYDELKADIDSVLGSRAENIKRMVDEQNAIRLINAELKQMEKNTGGGNYSPAQLKRVQQLNDALLTHKAALSEVRIALNNNAKMDNAAADSMKKLSLQLGQMRMAYRELTEEERKSPFGEELFKSINEVDAKLKEFDASIGNYQRNVGNYGGSFNGLNNSVQQIVRELPSATMGLNTFFLAVSNNIPILVDEIKRARVANENLKASGEKGIPVWKQVASSLFSWQTALMVGISLLTIYGKDIANWVKEIFKSKDAVNDLKEAQDKLNESFVGESSLGNQIALVSKLREQWSNLGSELNAQKEFIKENKEKFDELGVSIANVKDAENLLVQNTDAYIAAMQQRAKATAGMKLAAEMYEKVLQKQSEIEKERAKGVTNADKLKASFANQGLASEGRRERVTAEEVFNNRINQLETEKTEIEELAKAYVSLSIAEEDNSKQTLENAGFKTKEDGQSQISQKKDLSDMLLSIQRENQQKEINLMEEGEQKRLKQIDLNYQLELDKINKWKKQLLEAQGGKLTDEQESMFGMAFVLAEDKRNVEMEDKHHAKLLEQYRGYFEQRKAIEERYNKDREGLKKAGASEDALAENEYLKNQALAEVDALFANREEEFRIWASQVVDVSLEELENLVLEAESMIEDMSKNDPNNKDISKVRAGLGIVKQEIEKRKSKGNEEEPSPKAEKKWTELYNTLRKVEKQFGEIGDAIGGTAGDIIGAAGEIASSTLTMIDGIKTLAESSATAMEETSNAAGESMSNVEKASVILTIISAALQIATKIAGMFSADYSNYNKAKENYESYVDVLDKVIDKQKELAETMTGQEAVKASEKAIEMIKKQADAAKELGKMRLNSGASVGSHSIGVRIKNNMTDKGWSEALSAIGYAQYNKIKEGRMEGLFNLSVQQLEKLQMEAPTFWAQLDGDVRDYLEQIIESNECIEQMKETLQETLTGMTFEDFSSDVLESLYDVEKGAEEIFDDMSDYMRKAMIKAMYVKNYEPEMQKWYDQWAKAMEDGVMTTQEKTSLDSLKESIINGAMAVAENINSMFDVSDKYNQEASAKGFETMTQDQAKSLDGRFTALQLSGEESNKKLTLMNATMNDLKTVGLNIQDVASSIQDLLANSYIELVTISENTGETVKCLKVIQSDIAQVKENTKNL